MLVGTLCFKWPPSPATGRGSKWNLLVPLRGISGFRWCHPHAACSSGTASILNNSSCFPFVMVISHHRTASEGGAQSCISLTLPGCKADLVIQAPLESREESSSQQADGLRKGEGIFPKKDGDAVASRGGMDIQAGQNADVCPVLLWSVSSGTEELPTHLRAWRSHTLPCSKSSPYAQKRKCHLCLLQCQKTSLDSGSIPITLLPWLVTKDKSLKIF